MAHLVKCAVCGEQFDRDKIQAVKYSARRYAHYKCKPDGELVPLAEQKDPDLIKLEEYIKQLLNDTYVHPRVKKQINEFKDYWMPRIVEITDRYLGKGKKVSQCNREQVEALSLIVDDMKELVKYKEV